MNETVLVNDPLQWAGCYTLDLYCRYSGVGRATENLADDFHDYFRFPDQYTGHTFGECATQARKRGWVLHRNRTATCPVCAKRLKLNSLPEAHDEG